MTAIYRVGERVDGLYDENTDDMWYPGRIRSVHLSEATFEVIYDDGEVEMHVRQEFLRQHVTGTICVGTRVLCRYDGGEEFYPGQVSDVQEDGRYTIAYDDGEVEEDVPLEHIMEPAEKDEGKQEPEEKEEVQLPNNAMDDQPEHQQQAEQEEIENGDHYDKIADNNSGMEQENEGNQDNERDKAADNGPAGRIHPAIPPSSYEESPRSSDQADDRPDATPVAVSTERAYIIESLQLLEKRLGDAASTKSVLSTLVKQMRAYPQVTADLVHERDGERLLIDSLKFHQSHAVIQCYGCVLLRRLCFLCVKSTHYLLHNGIVELVIQAMNAFAEDAILQASACGALAVFTRVHAGLNILIEFQVAQLVLSTLIYHKTYSVHTRQVHYYACEVLLELCELDDLQTLNLLCGEQEEDFTGDMSPISLLLFLLRQGLSLDDKKACCAVGSLLMCLAASGRRAAALILSLNGLAELSTVMARYPTEPSIQKYSAAASKQIAMCSVRQSPTKRIKDTATEILREAESIESTPREPLPKKRPSRRSTNTGKRKSIPSSGYGAAANSSRGSAINSSTSYRGNQAFSKVASPYSQMASGFGGDMNSYNYPVSAPQQPSSLVILDGGIGMDSGFGSTNNHRRLSKEDRQSELFDAYGIHEIPNGRPYGTKRAQLRAHLASAETTWATPQHRIPSSMKPYSSRSEHLDHGRAYSHQDSSRHHRWDFDTEEHQDSVFEAEPRQPRGGKRKKKNPSVRTAFQVKLENENQLRVSREARSPYPSPQRLGAATKRAAKARHKRIAATGHSSKAAKSTSASSESLNEYATQLFQDSASRGGTHFPARSRLTPREKEEIRERERLSFAEKLHKMIDKAKSTLASSNTMDSMPFPPKSSKASRKMPMEKRPLSERTRALVSTPKEVEKEVLTPRETAETRPAKPTSRTSKRSESSSVPVVPRPKPTITRSVVTPKSTTDTRSRGGKTTKAAPTKTAEKAQVEKPKETAVKSIPVEATPVANILEVDGPHPDKALDQPVEEVDVAQEAGPTIPVDPEASCPNVAVEMKTEAVPSNAVSEQPAEPTPLENRTVVLTDESSNELPRIDAAVDDAATVVQTETPDASVSPPQAVEAAVAPELTADAPGLSEDSADRQTLLEEPSAVTEPTVDLLSGGNAAVDAMYGDAFNEFDDNGGEDEYMTVEGETEPDDTHTPAPESSDLKGNPMQESKSGEALYDDYDEFDEDEPPQDKDVEVEDNPVEVAAAEITTPLTATEPDPVENVPEGEGEAETPSVVAEHSDSVFPGGNGGDVDAEPSESKPEARNEPQPEVPSNDNAPGNPRHDFEPVVDSTEDQESVNLDTVSLTVPSDENAADGDPYSNPVDDPDKIDGATESAPDEGTRENVGTEPDTDAELTEAEGAAENAETRAQLEGETSESRLLNEAIVSVDITTEETNVNPVQPQQDEEDKAGITPQQDALQMSDEAATSIEQDDDAKKLTADNSVASVQSAVYDEDNFDDEVKLEETDPNEAGNVAAAEEVAQVAEPQQEDKLPDTAPNPEPIAAVSNDPENESKVLVANSSELSVSAAYDDDGFEDGAQEDSQADASENKAPEQEPSVDEKPNSVVVDALLEADVGDNPIAAEPNCDGVQEEQAPENEAPTAASAPEDEATMAITPESAPEIVDVASDLTPESGVIAEPSVVTVSKSPDSLVQEEDEENVQEPANVDAEKDGAGQVNDNVGSANEGDSVLTPEPDIDESPAPTSTEETVTDPSPTADTLEDETSESNTLTDATPAQDEAKISEIAIPSEPVEAQNDDEGSEQPASYDDDNFVPNVENVEPDLVAKEATDEGLEDIVSEIPSSGQQGNDVGESPTAAVDNEDGAAKEEETPPEGNLEELSHPKQAEEDAAESSIVLGKPDDYASDFVSEAGNPSENEEDHVEAPIENEPAVDPESDEVVDFVPAIESSGAEITATPAIQPDDQDVSVSPDDESLGADSAADAPQAERIPDPGVESDIEVESTNSATGFSQDAGTTEEAREELASESEQRPSDIVSTDIPAEPSSVDDTTEYDAEFDDTENDDTPLKDDTPENGPIQNEIGANNEVAPEYGNAEFDDTENDAVVLKKENEPILNEIDVTEEATSGDNIGGTATDEAADQLTDEQTANENTNESVAEEVNEPTTGSTVADADEPTLANVDLELSNPTATEADVDLTVASVDLDPPVTEEAKTEANVDASQYEEDFPDETSPETQDTEPISTSVEAADSANTPTETEAVSIEANPDNDENASELLQSASDEVAVPGLPKDELYDDGFDDNDYSNPIETSSITDGDRATNGADSTLEGNTDATLDKSNAKVEETDAADTLEVQPTEVPAQSDSLESEPVSFGEVKSVPMEPETAPVEVEVEDSASMELETVGVEPPPMESEVSTPMIETNEFGGNELETGEPDALRHEVVEPVTVQSEAESVEVNVVESEGVELAADPRENTLTTASLDADPETVERSPLESETAAIASAPEGQEERKVTDPSAEHQDAGQEELLSEPSEVSTPIENKSDATEVPVKTEVETPIEDGSATGEEAKEDAPLEEKVLIEEVAVDQHQDEVPLEDTTSALVESPPAENPVEAATDEQEQPAQSEAEHTPGPGLVSSEDAYLADDNSGGAVDSADGVSQENQEAVAESSTIGDTDQVKEGHIEATVEPSETPKPTEAISEPSNDAQPIVEGQQVSDEPDYAEDDETYEVQSIVHKVSIDPSQEDHQVGAESPNGVVKSDTAQGNEDTDETTSEAIETPEPTEAIVEFTHKEQRTAEDEASDETDYAEDDTMEDESLKDDSKIAEEFTGVENIGLLPQGPAVQESANVPEADELAIESELPEPDQTVASSEGPKTEDQYDDDEGYNEFDDQENDSPPTVEAPAPATTAVTKAPATEEEYDEYENDEYGDEEKPSETPLIAPNVATSTLHNPPTSPREEEIDEMADEPEEAEEDTYADDQEEYEEDEAPTVLKTSIPPKQDKSVPKQAQAEASTDEYEYDNEEEDYVDDEIEDSSPPKPAPAVRAAKSDDEMEEELESEEDYASD